MPSTPSPLQLLVKATYLQHVITGKEDSVEVSKDFTLSLQRVSPFTSDVSSISLPSPSPASPAAAGRSRNLIRCEMKNPHPLPVEVLSCSMEADDDTANAPGSACVNLLPQAIRLQQHETAHVSTFMSRGDDKARFIFTWSPVITTLLAPPSLYSSLPSSSSRSPLLTLLASSEKQLGSSENTHAFSEAILTSTFAVPVDSPTSNNDMSAVSSRQQQPSCAVTVDIPPVAYVSYPLLTSVFVIVHCLVLSHP